ncbi:unnamed protein product, partial [Didymodactylos carnosus]
MMFGDLEKHAGKWDSSTTFLKEGISGGPLIIFDQQNHVLISSFSEFMSTSMSHRGFRGGSIEFGIMGSIDPIPSNYSNSFIVYYGNKGINDAVYNWGLTLRKYYNKTENNLLNDLTINYLEAFIRLLRSHLKGAASIEPHFGDSAQAGLMCLREKTH